MRSTRLYQWEWVWWSQPPFCGIICTILEEDAKCITKEWSLGKTNMMSNDLFILFSQFAFYLTIISFIWPLSWIATASYFLYHPSQSDYFQVESLIIGFHFFTYVRLFNICAHNLQHYHKIKRKTKAIKILLLFWLFSLLMLFCQNII